MLNIRGVWIGTWFVILAFTGMLAAQETPEAKGAATEKKAESKSKDDPVPPPPPPPRAVKKPGATKEAPAKSQASTAVLPNAATAQLVLVKIQLALGQNPECDGIQITSVRFDSDQEQALLVVEGRLSEARLRSVAARTCGTVLREVLEAESGAVPEPRLDRMTIVKPSQREAIKAFNEGLAFYRQGNYDAANKEITRAISENSFNLGYKYWLVVVELAAGHDDQARRLLRPLILRRTRATTGKQMDEYVDVLRRLESVQGAVRQKMNRLDEELLKEVADSKN
jgi:tetratricopeptide (TPR) repeat protein